MRVSPSNSHQGGHPPWNPMRRAMYMVLQMGVQGNHFPARGVGGKAPKVLALEPPQGTKGHEVPLRDPLRRAGNDIKKDPEDFAFELPKGFGLRSKKQQNVDSVAFFVFL